MLMKEKATKIYLVEFNTYTNYCHNTVSCMTENKTTDYMDIPIGGLLVKEKDLAKYSKYGNGYANIKLVGSIYEDEETK